MPKVAVIGAGFSGLSAAAYLAAAGYEVSVFEKHDQVGGRARQFRTPQGYVFDMGPSWYWMPEVFERFFSDFGHKPSDFYQLERLDPAFDVVFDKGETWSIPDNFEALCRDFEALEPGAGARLVRFMNGAEFKYRKGIEDLVYKPGLSLREFMDFDLLKGVFRLQVFSSFSDHIRRYFTHPRLLALMEFPVLFLGAMPQDTPALYSLMNYAGLKLGTWYPQGGFARVTEAMAEVARSRGAQFHFNQEVREIRTQNNRVYELQLEDKTFSCDAVVASADYSSVEQRLLAPELRNYDDKYWNSKTFAPSCLVYYLGVRKKIDRLRHHTLFFHSDFHQHALEIYKTPQWPTDPLFYVCCPSKTDDSVAPPGCENLFLLMPLAPDIRDSESERERYFQYMIQKLESFCDTEILPFIEYKKSYCVDDFKKDYYACKGNAYGLANTLLQTAHFKPKIRNKKIKNLFYAGQLTVPGPGVPPCIISGKLASEQINTHFAKLTPNFNPTPGPL